MPRNAPPPRRRRGLLIAIIVALLLIMGGVTAGLVIVTRLETGEWKMPDPGEVVRIIKREPKAPAKVIFLERKPIEITPGTDDSMHNVSSVLENVRIKAAPHTHANGADHDHVSEEAAEEAAPAAKPADHDHSTHDHGTPLVSAATTSKTPTTKTPTTKTPTTKPPATKPPAQPSVTETGMATREVTGPAKLPGWKGTDKQWKQVMTCVQKLFEPFDVKVVDTRPTTEEFVLVAVGGKPADIGVNDKRVGGLAPFHGGVIAKPVVFAFSSALNNDVKTVCETIGMEVAHSYGLDHLYLCSDVMTYLKPCGAAKSFVDKDAACGELEPRNCEGGEPTQNSFRRLLQVLGPSKTAAAPTGAAKTPPR